MLAHENIINYYKTNFALVQHHKYSLTELEDMIPFERDIYVTLLAQHIKDENERIKEQEARSRSSRRR